jgi:O-antigen/teichoic acid export membrane protein
VKLVKTGFLNGIATGVRILSSIGLNKILAIYIGPGGYATIGQFQNMMTLVTTFANGAVNTGVTKYTAEYFDDEQRQHAIWRTAGVISLAGSLIATILMVLGHRRLGASFLGSAAYGSIILWFSATLTLVVLNGLLLSILNGKKEIGLFVAANISSSLIGAALSAALATQLGVYGALLALAVNQALVFIVTLALCRRTAWFRLSTLIGPPERDAAKRLGTYSLMAVTSAAVVPLSQILIRTHITNQLGLSSAGYWQAIVKISDMYLMLITAPLAVYYLPRIAEIRIGRELRDEIIHGYAILLPVTAACGLCIYLLRDPIIILTLTRRFMPMRDLFGWQMIGDVFKIAGWLVGYALVGQAMVRLFIATEVIFSATLVVLTFLLTRRFGLVGAPVAFCANYAAYFVVVAACVGRRIQLMMKADLRGAAALQGSDT